MSRGRTAGYVPPLRILSRLIASARSWGTSPTGPCSVIACRTEQMEDVCGAWNTPDCEQILYAYHSCGNRSCPKCGSDETQRWIAQPATTGCCRHTTGHGNLYPATWTWTHCPFKPEVHLPSVRANPRRRRRYRRSKFRFVGRYVGMRLDGRHLCDLDQSGKHPHGQFIAPRQ